MENQLEALIVGSSSDILWGLPNLLSRAGFAVDVISTARVLRSSKFIRTAYDPESVEAMMRLAHRVISVRSRPYDWIIPGEDATLKALSELEWPPGKKAGFPSGVVDDKPSHIYSKIGLSQVLSNAGIQTPPFCVVSTCGDALVAAREIGYPVLLKVDVSFGGLGVRECRDDADILRQTDLFNGQSLLLQKRISGQQICLDGTFIRHTLVHFSYSLPLRSAEHFGPSIVRRYYPLPLLEEKVFDEMRMLGETLGADGFANIACIDAEDGSGRYYFEADLRPNVWVNYSRYFGEDPAERIRKGFSSRAPLTKEGAGSPAGCSPVTIPYFLRLRCWELLVNRYQVWKFVPFVDTRVVLRLLIAKAYWRFYVVTCALLPGGLKTAIKRPLATVCARFSRRGSSVNASRSMIAK